MIPPSPDGIDVHSGPDQHPPAGPPEPAWPSLAALLCIGVLNWLLPDSLQAGPGWLAVVFVVVLAMATVLAPRLHLVLGYFTLGFVTLALCYALYVLVRNLVLHQGAPTELLQAALTVWSMNILVFASWYWRLDAGGPHQRARHHVYFGGAFLFPQFLLARESRKELGVGDWRPRFVDYLFLAFNTSTAFSPTDVPVLSAWAKGLMMIQSSISLATLAVVAARAVNIL